MNSEFVQTGQTVSEEGSAYCPVERKRRGPAALAASMSILVLGAGFLTYSMMSAPLEVSAPQDHSALPAPETQRVVIAVNNPVSDMPAEDPVKDKTAPEPMTLEEALAESRAARAGVRVGEPSQADGLTPRLKPSLAKTADGDDGVTPRLKPSAKSANSQLAGASAPHARALKIGSLQLASTDDAPPPFFSSPEFERRNEQRRHAPVALTADLDRHFGELLIRITKGETFVDALKRAGVRALDRNEAAYAFGKHYNLRQLRPGQEMTLTLGWPNQTLFQLAAAESDPEARLMGLEFRADPEHRITLRRNRDGEITAEKSAIALTTRTLSIAGRINGSLYLSAKAVGAPDEIIADLADAFAYDVDFQREIFGGDEFEAIFEARYDDQGALVSTGDILYARLNWRGRSKEKGYYRFAASSDGDRGDFYDATGQSAKRLLMKTPIDGARLSSGFGTRKHPILGYRRAHKGVDFAASRGTPVKAAGDGVVERADRYGSFGNYIRIRHANGYKTAYAHLKGFRRGVRKGKRVRQGDIIAYVGTTGRSTGPHLHYEVHLNGKAVNPQRLKIATGKKLKGDDLERFKVQRDLINAMRLPPEEGSGLLAKDESADKSAL